MRMVGYRSGLVVSLVLVVAVGQFVLSGDLPRAGRGDGRVVASSGDLLDAVVPSGWETSSGWVAVGGPSVPSTGVRSAAGQGSPTPQATTGTAVGVRTVGTAAPAQAAMDPATIGMAAICDGATATWFVTWVLQPIAGPITVTAAIDPVNGVVVMPPSGVTTAPPLGRLWEAARLPGTATVTALAATLTLPDGSSQVENRTVQLGAPCTIQTVLPSPVCDPSQTQIDLSTTADQVATVVTGSCAGDVVPIGVRMPDPRGLNVSYYSVAETQRLVSTATRQVVAADLPACQWTVTAGRGTAQKAASGGSGFCTDDTMTVTGQCPHTFVLTLTNGADATLPTTFTIVAADGTQSLVRTYHQVAPGHSVVVALSPQTLAVMVYGWSQLLGSSQWQRQWTTRCFLPSPNPTGGRGSHIGPPWAGAAPPSRAR
jgi:hypothetical protein